MICRFCKKLVHKTEAGYWSDGMNMPTFCGHSDRGGNRQHEPELVEPMISWNLINAASDLGESAKLYAWPRVLERLRSAERSCLLLFIGIVVLGLIDAVELLRRW